MIEEKKKKKVVSLVGILDALVVVSKILRSADQLPRRKLEREVNWSK